MDCDIWKLIKELISWARLERFESKLEFMDADERDEILWDNGLDPDDYDF